MRGERSSDCRSLFRPKGFFAMQFFAVSCVSGNQGRHRKERHVQFRRLPERTRAGAFKGALWPAWPAGRCACSSAIAGQGVRSGHGQKKRGAALALARRRVGPRGATRFSFGRAVSGYVRPPPGRRRALSWRCGARRNLQGQLGRFEAACECKCGAGASVRRGALDGAFVWSIGAVGARLRRAWCSL